MGIQRITAVLTLAAAPFVVAAGCTWGDADTDLQQPGDPADTLSGMLGPEGGTFHSRDGVFTVELPPNLVPVLVPIQIRRVAIPPLGMQAIVLGSAAYQVSVSIDDAGLLGPMEGGAFPSSDGGPPSGLRGRPVLTHPAVVSFVVEHAFENYQIGYQKGREPASLLPVGGLIAGIQQQRPSVIYGIVPDPSFFQGGFGLADPTTVLCDSPPASETCGACFIDCCDSGAAPDAAGGPPDFGGSSSRAVPPFRGCQCSTATRADDSGILGCLTACTVDTTDAAARDYVGSACRVDAGSNDAGDAGDSR